MRTRENNSEFGHSGSSGKVLRLALGSLVFKAKDSQLSSRLLGMMSRVKNLDTVSARGKRKVSIGLTSTEGKLALKGFDFNGNAPFKSVFYASYDLDTTTGSVSIVDFVPAEQLQLPQGATHVSLQSAVLAIDFETEVSELRYSPVVNVPINLTASSPTLTPTSVPTGTGVQLFLISLTFYQEINGVQYSLKNESFNVLHVLEVL
ncbi:hypothetical protein [Flavobacterium sp. 9AF]|uniref:hypothetical protein n=1 Tax=Flavobacterium sp. 9AF TaxID=2653142 RepID=UPI001F35DA8B|nr:hypothetical protein [Flavobacterium sp. 9AF]